MSDEAWRSLVALVAPWILLLAALVLLLVEWCRNRDRLESPIKPRPKADREQQMLRRMRLLHRELAEIRGLEPMTDTSISKLPTISGCPGFEWILDTAFVTDDGGLT